MPSTPDREKAGNGRRPPNQEAELKLQLPAGARQRLEQHPALRPPLASPAYRKHEVTTYFDTPDRALARRALSLRIRRTDQGWVQALKAQDEGSTVLRGEWEWPLASEALDLRQIAQSPLGPDLLGELGDRLGPVCVTDIHRTVRELRLDEHTAIEASFDEGSVSAGPRSTPLSELELELKEGGLGTLYRLGLDLDAAVPMAISLLSKAEQGYRLKAGFVREAPRARPIERSGKLTAHEGFGRIIASGVEHLVGSAGPALLGEVEGVHQLRVAIRRLRAALVLFDRRLEPRATARFNGELGRLGQLFGEARDWDVYCLETVPAATSGSAERDGPAAPEAAEAWRQLLTRSAEPRRKAAHERLAAELGGPALGSLVLGLGAWTQGHGQPSALDPEVAGRPLRRLAPELLDRLARTVRRRARGLSAAPEAQLHALRKSVKKLRYGLEFLGDLDSPGPARRCLKRCKQLQSLLGDLNDVAMLGQLTTTLADEAHPGLAAAFSGLERWRAERRQTARRRLGKAWDGLERTLGFW